MRVQLKIKRRRMKTYSFKVGLEPDEEGWRAFYPPWEEIGASTWGKTKEKALRNIQEVLSLILEEFVGEEKPISIVGG